MEVGHPNLRKHFDGLNFVAEELDADKAREVNVSNLLEDISAESTS